MQRIFIGKILKPHGIKGEMKVLTEQDSANRFKVGTKYYLEDGRMLILKSHRQSGGFDYVSFEGVDDRNAVEEIQNFGLFVDEENLRTLEPDEYFDFELLEYRFIDESGLEGEVEDILHYTANDILVLRLDKKQVLVPLVRDFIEEIDSDDKVIRTKRIREFIDEN